MSERMNAINFEDKACSVHGTKFDYSGVSYNGAHTKVSILCPKHGTFLQSPSKHVNNGHGCPKCGGTTKLTKEEFIQKARQKHGSFVDRFDYSAVNFVNMATKVTIVCKIHGPFCMTPNKHLGGQSCQKCKSVFSLQAIAWLEYIADIEKVSIKHALKGGEERIVIDGKGYLVDGFCVENHTIYQFHGDFYHGNPNVYKPEKVNTKLNVTFTELFQKTMQLQDLMKSAGYRVVSIWEADWNQLCRSRGMDPHKACSNPDVEIRTSAERKQLNMDKSSAAQRLKMQTDPIYAASRKQKVQEYKQKNRDIINQSQREYYIRNRKEILRRQRERLQRRKE